MKWFFLVGFMGVGKTTLGSMLAEKMELPFFDLDERIELDAGMSVQEIFDAEGEEAFRNRETRMLEKLIDEEPAGVMATGGGTFTRESNRRIMSAAGISVWLDVPVDEVLRRVGGAGRPLWRSTAEARDLANRRREDYRLANHRLELASGSPDQGAIRLYELLAPYRSES